MSNTTSPNSWLLGSLPGESGGSGGTNYMSGTSTARGKIFSTYAPAYVDYSNDNDLGISLVVGNFDGGDGLVGTNGGAGGAASYFASGAGHTADNTDHKAAKDSGGAGSTSTEISRGGAAWVGIYY